MRTSSVITLHTSNRFTVIGQPLMIAGFSFSAVVIIGIIGNIVGSSSDVIDIYNGMKWNGAIFALIGPLMGLGIGAMTQYFPLATGFGLTRKEFAGGTTIVFLATALAFAAFVTVGKVVESVTNGWWLHIRFFNVVYTGLGPAWQTLVQTFLIICLAMFIGATLTTMVNRWGTITLWVFFAALAVLSLVVIALATINLEFHNWILGLLNATWWQGMLTIAALTIIAAASWLALMRKAQVR
ncbi:hypothetical protein [Microbacterium sp. YY-01]|uniref:hypothetical protein n=1 Tax=Microbacterium sp. YY-01 TaxID=3421634 RepID=UPI003D16BC66